jgi:hypothetical protein
MDLIDPKFTKPPSIEPSASVIFNLLLEITNFINTPYVVVPASVVWIYLAVTRRADPKSWTFAFLSGLVVPLILFRWVFRWI